MSNLIGKLVLGIMLVMAWGCNRATNDRGISSYLSVVAELANWSAVDTVQTFEGQDLFLLINGGAELYHQNGFVRVVAQTFENSTGRQISVELHEMSSAAGALAIYKSKVSPGGEALGYGEGAVLNSYYVNAHQDRFQLTLVGYDSEAETIDGLKKIAEAILRHLE